MCPWKAEFSLADSRKRSQELETLSLPWRKAYAKERRQPSGVESSPWLASSEETEAVVMQPRGNEFVWLPEWAMNWIGAQLGAQLNTQVSTLQA